MNLTNCKVGLTRSSTLATRSDSLIKSTYVTGSQLGLSIDGSILANHYDVTSMGHLHRNWLKQIPQPVILIRNNAIITLRFNE